MASSSGSPCAACKFLRRKCTSECVFSPYFPPDQPLKFANVHKIFGASNISKLLIDLPPQQREDAVNSLAYEADARVKDPVYGCVGAISLLQRQVSQLQQELGLAQSDLARAAHIHQHQQQQQQHHHHHQQIVGGLDLNSSLHRQFIGIQQEHHHHMHHPHHVQQQQQPWIEISASSSYNSSPAAAAAQASHQNFDMLVIQGDFSSSPTRSTIINDGNVESNSGPAAREIA